MTPVIETPLEGLDDMLKQLFETSVDVITNGDMQIGFEPPNEDWRQYVSTTLKDMALNVYLVDLKENRILRSNERVRDFQNGMFTETAVPRRMDCHYLISAWSPATANLPTVEPTRDEHALLYKAVTALMDAEPFIARQIYGGTLPSNFPNIIADAELPSTILPVEGFPKLAEFWGETKTVHWKPAVYLIVTLPVVLPLKITGPMVTTRIAEYQMNGNGRIVETLIQIGGSVVAKASGKPLPGAWLMLEDSSGNPLQTITTDADGHFTFGGLTAGNYQLRVRAQGFHEPIPPIKVAVPSPTGSYDVQLT
jgi:hypothetical protein